jgi:hypothetical protein
MGQLALGLGAIIALYAIVSNTLGVLLPDDGRGGDRFLVLTLPLLLAGMIGLIAGYRGGVRSGALAGLLVGLWYLVVNQVSGILTVGLAFPAIQRHALASSAQQDYARYMAGLGHAPDLGQFLRLELLEDGFGFIITVAILSLALQGLTALLGGVIGVALRGRDAARGQGTRPATGAGVSARFLFLVLGLGALVWLATAEYNAVGGAHRLYDPVTLANSLLTPTFGLWLLGLLAALAFALAGARAPRAARV